MNTGTGDTLPTWARTLFERLAVLEAADAERRRRHLRRGDPAFLARLFPAIHGALGSDEFLSHHLTDSDDAGLRLVVGTRTAKSLGRLLARAEGVPIGEYVLEACGNDPIERVRRWRLVGVIRGFYPGTATDEPSRLTP